MFQSFRFPIAKLLLALLAGILFDDCCVPHNIELAGRALILLLFLFIFPLFSFFFIHSYKARILPGISILLQYFFFGMLIALFSDNRIKADHIENYFPCDYDYIIVKVTSQPESTEKTYKFQSKIIGLKSDENWVHYTGKVLCYVQKDSRSHKIKYGNYLIISSRIREVKPPPNPGQFNYSGYLAHKTIYHHTYINADAWFLSSRHTQRTLVSESGKVRNNIQKKIKSLNLSKDDFALASALLLGSKDKLSDEQKENFSSAGAMHVLCVSGLHVGIIYIVLGYCFVFLKRNRNWNVVRTILIILLIWAYAFITGLAPSVLRASLMFSFIALGSTFKRHTNIFNTLFASALILLIINPQMLFAVGFQLSYLALMGILSVQPFLYQLWSAPGKAMDKIWSLTTVSIAAQLATFPLALLYFHQFPNYFIITNLIVIPLAGMIIYSGIIALICSPIPYVHDFFRIIFKLFLKTMNGSVHLIDNLPFSTTKGILLVGYEVLFLYLFFLMIGQMISTKNKKIIYYLLSLLIIFALVKIPQHYYQVRQRKIVIYSISNQTGLDFITGRVNLFLADNSLISNDKKMSWYVREHWLSSNVDGKMCSSIDSILRLVESFNHDHFFSKGAFIQFHDKKIAVIDSDIKLSELSSKKTQIDYLLIIKNPSLKISEIKNLFDPGLIIFDLTNS
ncbi:MAG: ComEC family competence protein, partial [Bacteroidales bacterium]|nr:ComEC family competence protein [Bacteroidales bacterium]